MNNIQQQLADVLEHAAPADHLSGTDAIAWRKQRDAALAAHQRATAEFEDIRPTAKADAWRHLALQFDRHRMEALWHLTALLASPSARNTKLAQAFIKAGPSKADGDLPTPSQLVYEAKQLAQDDFPSEGAAMLTYAQLELIVNNVAARVAMKAKAEDDLAAIEREHFGDPDKGTGVYAQREERTGWKNDDPLFGQPSDPDEDRRASIASGYNSDTARQEVAEFFGECLKRHDFSRYIRSTLAADFACALAPVLRQLREQAKAPAHGWVTMWPAMGGGRKPVYSHGPEKPGYGPQLDALLTVYPVYASAHGGLT